MVAPMNTDHRRTRHCWVIALVACFLVGAACSGGTSKDTATSSTSTTTTYGPVPATSTPSATPTATATAPSTIASTVASTVAPAAPAAPLRWAALGDSYSAGIGASTSEQKISANCSRDPLGNYATLGAKLLADRGRVVELDVRACDGATVKKILDEQLPGIANADAITLTIGGNDFGFSRILTDCLLRGCRSYDQDNDRFLGFVHEDGRTDWQVLEQRIGDALLALRPALAPRGRVYLLTYPVPFPEQPDESCIRDRAPINDVSRTLANAAIDRLDQTMLAAAATANTKAGAVFVTIVEWRTGLDKPLRITTDGSGVVRRVRDNPNGICSPDPMINGIAQPDLGDSFHPTDRGLAHAADVVTAAIRARGDQG